MIYGIAGASGTGKTTLGTHVGEALDIPFVRTSVTEMARNAGFNAVGRLSLPDRLKLQQSLLEQFEELLNKVRGPVILDRTPLDLIGYLGAEIHMHSHLDLDVESLQEIDAYFTRCQDMTSRYFDMVFVTMMLPHYEAAETRPEYNPAYQRHVQLLILGSVLSAPNQLCVSILETDDLHDRVETMSSEVSERLDAIERQRLGNFKIH